MTVFYTIVPVTQTFRLEADLTLEQIGPEVNGNHQRDRRELDCLSEILSVLSDRNLSQLEQKNIPRPLIY